MLSGRLKEKFNCQISESLFKEWCKLVWGLREFTKGIWLGICVTQSTFYRVSISCSCGTMSGCFVNFKKKVDMRSFDTEPLSALD